MVQVQLVPYRPKGPVRDLFEGLLDRDQSVRADWPIGRFSEVLIEGPAGTGKSYGVLQWFHALAQVAPPGTRILWVRKTLQSMRESVQVTFEEKVLADDDVFRGELLRGPSRNVRRAYDYPTGVHIGLGGLDKPERLYSTEWDIVWCEELIELSLQEWSRFARSLRNHKLPWQLRLGTTNPKSQYSWPNRRWPAGYRRVPGSGDGRMLRLLSRHEDNPTVTDTYLEELEALPEPLRSQLYLGLWVSASGLVWPQYDEGTHLLDSEMKHDGERWLLVDRAPATRAASPPERVKFFAGSMDFGWRVACLGVWAITDRDRGVLVREVYRGGWHQTDWADCLERINEEYPIQALFADSAEPGFISYLNAELTFARGRKTRVAGTLGPVVRPADKSKGKQHGLMAVRRALDKGLIAFLRPERRMWHWPWNELPDAHPTCSTEEIPDYVYPDPDRATTDEARAKREQDERPAPSCVDHGCDMIEYFCTAFYGSADLDLSPPEPPRPPAEPGTAQWVLDLPEVGQPRRPRR